jgi:hypothetical protein
MTINRRPLRSGEVEVLGLVQSEWGPQNTEDLVEFATDGEAHLWVRDRAGQSVMFMSLTNLADWYLDGSLSRERLADWVRGPGARGA